MNKKAFGKRIQKYRLKSGLTQSMLANKICKGKNFISEIERGIKLPSLPVFVAIARELNTSTDNLLKDSLNLKLEETKKHYYTDEQLMKLEQKIHDIIIDNFDV